MSDLMPAGTYAARATGEYQVGRAGTGTEQAGVEFEFQDGDHAGKRLTWYGNLNTPENIQRTMKSLRACGWKTDDITDLDGITENVVNVVVEIDEYKGERRNKIAWVNGAGVAMKHVLSEGERLAFKEKMKGYAVASRGGGAAPAASPKPKNTRTAPKAPPPAPAPTGDFGGADDEIPF